ncbi:MAG: hypothetical protein M5U01_40345 [Ardenticatenaceae bacterium]|nr:hypothetical protein [Ardenticatenaceae bacterium]
MMARRSTTTGQSARGMGAMAGYVVLALGVVLAIIFVGVVLVALVYWLL